MRHRLLWVGAIASALMMPTRATSQASPYVPLDDVAYSYIDALMARGWLWKLSSLERPYTVQAIRRAFRGDTLAVRDAHTAGWARALERSIAKYETSLDSVSTRASEDRIEVAFGASALLTVQSSARRDLMLADTSSTAAPGLGLHFLLRGYSTVAATRVLADRRLKTDPEFAGKTDRPLVARTEDAYVSIQGRVGELFLGRTARNWGPAPGVGLLLGNYAYTFDHLFARFGAPAANLSVLAARLDDHADPAGGVPFSRYLGAHRLSFRYRAAELAITEGILYSGQGRGFEPAMLNPLAIRVLGSFNEFRQGNDGNLMYSVDFAMRTRDFGRFSATYLIDDAQVDRCDDLCEEPTSSAFTIAVEGLPLLRGHRGFASYRRVSSLTYRTNLSSLSWTSFGLSLGEAFSDFDEARAGIDLAAVPQATLRFYTAYRRQGEGDYRLPFPTPDQYSRTPVFLIGTVRQIARVAMASAGSAGAFDYSADVGVNRTAKRLSVGPQTAFEGRVRFRYHPRWLLTLRPALDD